ALETFRRWPTWMWANREVEEFVGWLEWFNDGRPEEEKVGFYGLDVYSLWDSLRGVMRYLKEANDPAALAAARRAVRCFEPFGEESSWNVRDRHMAETLERLLAFTTPGARAVVWEHNTHIGDARYTDMAQGGEVNIGQLARERYGEKGAVLVGFGTYQGTVIA